MADNMIQSNKPVDGVLMVQGLTTLVNTIASVVNDTYVRRDAMTNEIQAMDDKVTALERSLWKENYDEVTGK